MQFIAICHDAPDSRLKRPGLRPDHLAYWKPREEAEQIILAGPRTDFAGSVFILEASSANEVHDWIRNDPYYLGGVFESYQLHPFKCVLPTSQFANG